MTGPRHNEDPELRGVLDSIGMSEGSTRGLPFDTESSQRAEAMLARIVSQPRDVDAARTGPSRGRGNARRWTTFSLAAAFATCVAVAMAALVFLPGAGPQPAVAQTPPMLSFSLANASDIQSAGQPARDTLIELAQRATHLSSPKHLPVQRVVAEAWWTSTDPAEGTKGPQTVLIPRHLEVYQFDDGSRRSIERRGAALDAQGRLADQPGSWNAVAPKTDETFPNDLGANYPQSLAATVSGLRQQLAPKSACGGTAGGCMLSAVADLFAGYVVDPSTTARIWRLLATEPTIQTLGSTTDRLGRRADAFVADALDPSQRILILIDPKTGRYLGAETVLVRPSPDLGFDPPAVTQFTAIVDSARIAVSEVPDDSTTTKY